MLTGKCREDFNNWYRSKYYTKSKMQGIKVKHINPITEVKGFELLPISMQYGVYVDFFDSVGLELVCFKYNNEFNSFVNGYEGESYSSTRNEARQKAIEKANEIYNESKIK